MWSDFNEAYMWLSDYDPDTAVVVRERFARAYVDSRDQNGGLTPAQFYAGWAGLDVAQFVSVVEPTVRGRGMPDKQQRETAVEQALKLASVRVSSGEHVEFTADQLVQDAEVIAKFLAGEQ